MSTTSPSNDPRVKNLSEPIASRADVLDHQTSGQVFDNSTGPPVPRNPELLTQINCPSNKDAYISPDGRTPVDHYIREGVECIDVMRAISTPAEFQAHCKLTAFKYLYRMGAKDGPLQEVKKAEDYLMWLRQSLEKEVDDLPRSPSQRIQYALDRRKSKRPETD